MADTFGLDGRSESLLVLSEADRDSDVGRGALDLMGVTLQVEALAEAIKVSGEGVSTDAEIVQGDGDGAHPVPAEDWIVVAESDHDDVEMFEWLDPCFDIDQALSDYSSKPKSD